MQRPARDGARCLVQLPFAREHVEILLDFAGVLVGVDAEIAEVAALPAERDVQVQTQRHGRRGLGQRREAVGRAPAAIHTENGG